MSLKMDGLGCCKNYVKYEDNIIYILRITISPSQLPWSFKIPRIHFLSVVTYAMTIKN